MGACMLGKSLYDRVKEEQAVDVTMEWIEKCDRLYAEDELSEKLKMENQLAFWRKNCDIRSALREIEVEVKSTSKPSVRLVGWSEIARKAKCDRNTLKKIERFEWVNNAREKLLKMLDEKNKKLMPLQIVMSEADEIQLLEKQAALSKEEAARWFVKYEEATRELQLVKEALERQIKANSQLAEQNQKLIKEKNKP